MSTSKPLPRLTPLVYAMALAGSSFAFSAIAQQAPAPAEPAKPATPAAPPASTANPAAAATAPKAPDAARLETVVVTAGKRVEKLEQVPAAISVITSEVMERENVRTLEDAISLSPAVTVTYGSTAANNGLNMRGIGTSSIGVGVEADVAVIVDDIPLGTQFQAFRDLSDVQRVEILKGPQSTLVGKNAIAGAISIVTKPVAGPLRGDFSTTYTSDREKRVRLSYGGDLTERFGMRVAASYNDFPGNVNNLTTGRKVNGSSGRTVIGKLVWRPTDRLDIEFSPRYNQNDSSCCTLVPIQLEPLQGALLNNIAQFPATLLYAGINIAPGNRNVRNDVETGIESKTRGAGLRINYLLPNDTQIASVTSTEHYTAEDIRDQDFVDVQTLLRYPLANGQPANVPQGYLQGGNYDIKSLTQELRVTSPEGNNKFKYVGGLWYGKNDVDREFRRGYDGIALTTPIRYFANTYNINKALFGQASWEFVPKFIATAGLRFNQQESGYWIELGPPAPAPFVARNRFEIQGNKENVTTGRLSLQYQFTPAVMAYMLGSTGYKGRAYDITSGITAATAATLPVPSEKAKNYEVGFKGNFLDGRMTVSMAAFIAKFRNYQQNSGSFLPNSTTFVTRLNSIGGVETRGFELDIAALLTRDFQMNLGVAYTDATVTEWPNAPCYSVGGSPNGGFNLECRLRAPEFGNTNVQDLKGATMPNAPKWKVSLSTKYDIPLERLPFNAFINASVRHQTRVITNINQDPNLSAPGFTTVNLGIGAADKKRKYRLTFFVNNVFDKEYALTGFTGLGSWSSRAPNPVVNVRTGTWTPARDAFRHYGLKFDYSF